MPPTSATSASTICCWLWLKFLRCGCNWQRGLLPGMLTTVYCQSSWGQRSRERRIEQVLELALLPVE
jgi:hypothetical protein